MESKYFHRLHVTLFFIFLFAQYSGTCTALPPNVGVEETKNAIGVFYFHLFSPAPSSSVLLLALAQRPHAAEKAKLLNLYNLAEHGWVLGSSAAV